MSNDKGLLSQLIEGRSPGELFGHPYLISELKQVVAKQASIIQVDSNPDGEKAESPYQCRDPLCSRRDHACVKAEISTNRWATSDIYQSERRASLPRSLEKYRRHILYSEHEAISIYARGLTRPEIRVIVADLCGMNVLSRLVSSVSDAVIEVAAAWQNRPLNFCYPLVIMDSILVNTRSGKTVSRKTVFVVLAVLQDRKIEILSLWFQPNEDVVFWRKVIKDLRNRGVQDIQIAIVDGLKGYPQAIQATFPRSHVLGTILDSMR